MKKLTKGVITKASSRVVVNVVLILATMVAIFPLYWLIISTFSPSNEVFHYPPRLFLAAPKLENTVDLFTENNYFRSLWNSLAATTSFVVLSLFLCSIAGYTFAKFNFPFKNALFLLVLSTYAIPFAIQLIPLFIIMVKIRLSNTLLALFLPWISNAFGIFWLRQNLLSFPDDLLDAARIDGFSEFGIYVRIVLPNLRPALFSYGIIQFIFMYNDFLWPLIIIHQDKKYTLPLLLAAIRDKLRLTPVWGELIAGCFYVTIPMIIIYILFQKNLVKAISGGALKG